MTPTEPLAKLLLGNLREAINLSLLTATPAQMDDFEKKVQSIWRGTGSEVDRYSKATELAVTELDADFVARECLRSRTITVARVMPVKYLHFLFRDLAGRLVGANRKRINDMCAVLEVVSETAAPMVPDATQKRLMEEASRKIVDAVDFFRTQVCDSTGHPVAASIDVSNLVKLYGDPCWIARRTGAGSSSSAQYWRDRLGLEHYPHKEGHSWAPKMGDSLVRVTFAAQTSKQVLPANGHHAVLAHKDYNKDLWLVRPTVRHAGNLRFSQRHGSDKDGRPFPAGRTIDLKDKKYRAGERELILLHGPLATMQWQDLELMDGIPCRHPHDLDHGHFVNVLGGRFGWT